MDPFLLNALLGGLMSSVMAGVMGTVVVTFRMSMLAGGLAHIAYGGVGLGYFMGFSPFLGALGAAMASSALLSRMDQRRQERFDSAVGALWAFSMALGVILMSLSQGYGKDLSSPLFGNLLAVSREDLWVMALLTGACLAAVSLLYPDLLAVAYDEEFARVRGLNPGRIRFAVLMLTAVAVVVLMRSVGLVLCMALMTIPPYAAEGFSRSLKGMMFLSTLYGSLCVLAGIWISWRLDMPSGACIVMAASGLFAILGLVRGLARRFLRP
ncbi:MAG: metal ABC transporter permease [Thermanaerothrix sp.]|nr:metal ABC transporter permease [Thermanaerothrix sp.]